MRRFVPVRLRRHVLDLFDRLTTKSTADGSLLHLRRRTPRPRVVERDPIGALDMLRPPGTDGQDFADLERQRRRLLDETDLSRRIGATWWYHTIELPGGVVTPGYFDHRPLVDSYGFPSSLSGRRALDVATFDGFWAFEMERRGAEVTALDLPSTSEIDFPPSAAARLREEEIAIEVGRGFAIAATALGSKVQRREGSVYGLNPEEWGTFDLVHVGDLLLHLERPLEALRRIRSVTGGSLHISDAYDPRLPGDAVRYRGGWEGAVWWVPSLDTLCQWVVDAGFRDVKVLGCYRLDGVPRGERGLWRAIIDARP